MPRDAHTNAAYHHERAAKSHRAAAQHSGNGAHDASVEHAEIAVAHSTKAEEATKLALAKSIERTKQKAVAAK